MQLYHQLHVLILDLDSRRQEELAASLKRLGVESILSARTLIEVEHLLSEYPIDLIFLGDQLPKMPASRTVAELRRFGGAGSPPLIWYTDTQNPRGLAEQVDAGLTMALWHPNNPAELDRTIHRALHISPAADLPSLARRCSFFEGFTLEGVRKVIQLAIACRYAPGELIVRRNDPADSFFIVLSGRVEVVLPHMRGGQLVVPIEEGHTFGEMGILGELTRSAYCLAATNVQVLEIDSKLLLSDQDPIHGKILAKIAFLLASRLRQMNQAITPPEEQTTSQTMTSEQYGIAGRQIALRRHALGRKIPQQIREQLQREVCTHLKSDQLHLQWDPNWFAASGDRLKHPLHLVVVAENGHEWFDAIFADLPFTHQLVSRPDGGSFGTFLCGKEALSLFLKGQPPKDTPYRDRHLHIDHACTDVTHTTLFLVFESESGELTNTLRNAFPEHQIATVVQGQQSASSCSAATTMVERGENGFRIGETLFLPNLSRHFPDQPLGDAAALFATIDLLVEIGLGERPPLATAAQRAASAMYGGSSP